MPQYGFISLDTTDPDRGCDVCGKAKQYVTRLTFPRNPEAGRVAQVCKQCWDSLLDMEIRGVLTLHAKQPTVAADPAIPAAPTAR